MPAVPNHIRVEVDTAESLFDEDRKAVFPHTGRMLDEQIALYIESVAREFPKAPSIELEVAVRGPPPAAGVEAKVRDDLHHYFDCENHLARLENRVNNVEGVRSFTRTLWILIGGLVLAGVVYALVAIVPPTTLLGAFLTGFVYLAAITIVWVLFWDPFEKVVFVGFFLRARISAIDKLIRSEVRFSYPSSAPGKS